MKKISALFVVLIAAFFAFVPQLNFSLAADIGQDCTTTVLGDFVGDCVGTNVECKPTNGSDKACRDEGQCVGKCTVIGSCKTTDFNDVSGGCSLGNFCDYANDHSDSCTNDGQCTGICVPNDNGGSCQPLPNFPLPQGSCNSGEKCDISSDPTGKTGQCVPTGVPTPPCSQTVNVVLNGKTIGTKCGTVGTSLGPFLTDAAGFIQTIFGILLATSGAIALLLIIRAGYKIMTSQGNPEAIKEGREQLIAAIVGLMFLIFSFVFLQLIGVDILHIPGFFGGNSPQDLIKFGQPH